MLRTHRAEILFWCDRRSSRREGGGGGKDLHVSAMLATFTLPAEGRRVQGFALRRRQEVWEEPQPCPSVHQCHSRSPKNDRSCPWIRIKDCHLQLLRECKPCRHCPSPCKMQ